MRKYSMLALGWVLTLVGIVVTPMPIPIPLIGILPLMAGLAILIHYSRTMRRVIQRVRHRVRWISYMLEHFARRAPKKNRPYFASLASTLAGTPRAVAGTRARR